MEESTRDEDGWIRINLDLTEGGLAVKRDPDRKYTERLTRPTYDRWAGMSREYVWTDDAACNGVNPELFQVSQVGDPGLEGIGTHELREFNEAKLKKAQEYCEGCPVRATCLKKAEPVDLYWSVRGGERPEIMKNGGVKRFKFPTFRINDWVEWACRTHGRDAMRFRKTKDGSVPYCEACAKS